MTLTGWLFCSCQERTGVFPVSGLVLEGDGFINSLARLFQGKENTRLLQWIEAERRCGLQCRRV